jgi:hypothetical protein
MSYLEKKFIIHKNLSCQNFLVFNKTLVSRDKYILKIIIINYTDKTFRCAFFMEK